MARPRPRPAPEIPQRQLVAEPGQLDLATFTAGVVRARNARLARSSLALWHGSALADVSAAFADAARVHLDEQRLAAHEPLAELEPLPRQPPPRISTRSRRHSWSARMRTRRAWAWSGVET